LRPRSGVWKDRDTAPDGRGVHTGAYCSYHSGGFEPRDRALTSRWREEEEVTGMNGEGAHVDLYLTGSRRWWVVDFGDLE
jgi:hypothetical protein